MTCASSFKVFFSIILPCSSSIFKMFFSINRCFIKLFFNNVGFNIRNSISLSSDDPLLSNLYLRAFKYFNISSAKLNVCLLAIFNPDFIFFFISFIFFFISSSITSTFSSCSFFIFFISVFCSATNSASATAGPFNRALSKSCFLSILILISVYVSCSPSYNLVASSITPPNCDRITDKGSSPFCFWEIFKASSDIFVNSDLLIFP